MGNRAVRKWKKTRMVTAVLAVCSIFFGIIVGCQVKNNEKSEMLPIITIGTDQFEPYNYLDSKDMMHRMAAKMGKLACKDAQLRRANKILEYQSSQMDRAA